MRYDVDTVAEYIAALPDNRKPVIEKLRQIIVPNLPEGFNEQISNGMISYVVPLSRYPHGYHVKKNQPLPFMALASQKNHIALYHMGLYGSGLLEEWFTTEYTKRTPAKLDIGKSCIRFKESVVIPYDLIAELCRKLTVEDYIALYEKTLIRKSVSRGREE